MRLAVLADVHANAPALEAVLEDVAAWAPDAIVCLGDLVGYNAEPAVVVAHLQTSGATVVQGNHDLDVTQPPSDDGTHRAARDAQRWTRDVLTSTQLEWLAALPRKVEGPGWVGVHGCYLNRHHVTGYVTSTMLPHNLQAVAEGGAGRVAFCGHTHQPMLGWKRGEVLHEERPTRARWPSGCDAVLINPGAVGQPRDRDWRAAYARVDLEAREVEVRRLEYDVARTQRMIRDAELPESLASRLGEGR